MVNWKRKKRPFDDFFFDFDKVEEMMDRMMNEMVPLRRDESAFKRKPMVMGFSLKFDQSGKPVIEEFGDIKSREGKAVVADTREPLVDVNRGKKEVTITAELPGVEKKDVKVKAKDKHTVVISADSKEKPFYKEITLEEKIKKQTAKANFNNGVLEVTFEIEKPLFKLKKKKAEEGEIKVQ